jgi:hypothetical protein
MRYLIDDIRAGNKAQALGYFPDTTLLSADALTELMLRWPLWKELDQRNSLLVFPGNGAAILRSFLPPGAFPRMRWVSVVAKRVWVPGEPPQAFVNRIFPHSFFLGVQQVVILDDVFSSGETMGRLREINLPWIPGATWYAAAWVGQTNAKLPGFRRHHAGIYVGSAERRAPINSLSTLLKSRSIAASYATRKFGYRAKEFLATLDTLR